MRAGLAFFAGILGGAVMTALLIVVRIAGLTELNIAMTLGSMITREVTAGTWALGFVMHLVLSGLIALLYAAAFEALRRSTWWLGLIGGLIHAVIAGFVMLLMPGIHPIIPDVIATPGAFAVNYGATAAAIFVLLHAIFGLIVGGVYETVHTPLPPARRERIVEEPAVGAGAERHRT
jgi:hypothetical protein